jgi:pimeloyl-ACP methyl ester carboxylesterase
MQWVGSVTAVLSETRGWTTRLWRAFWVLSLLSATGCAWLDAKQREIIYRPTPGVPADFAGLRAGDQRFFIYVPQDLAQKAVEATEAPTTNQRIEMWWLPHPDKTAPTLLYFHGTFRNLYQNIHKIESLREAGFAVLAVEYRGWGVSTPIIPSEQTIMQDARLAWAELERREPRPALRVIYGHSMGSGVAVEMASRLLVPQDYGGLILESAFSSFADVARQAGLLAQFLAKFNGERFASIDKIAKVNAPLLMIHGDADTTIPQVLGERVFAAANPPKQWLSIAGGAHSDLDEVGSVPYQATLQAFRRQYLTAP